jgi:hypothetical protein
MAVAWFSNIARILPEREGLYITNSFSGERRGMETLTRRTLAACARGRGAAAERPS